MKIRLGYACITETLEVTSSSSYTYSSFSKEENFKKLDSVIESNFLALEEILIYNIKNGIHFYRMSSNLIPLATKREVDFDYIQSYQKYYQRLGLLIHESKMRVDFHPSEYCVLNSMRKEVVDQSIDILKYHYQLLEQFQIKDKVLILHIGSLAGGKDRAISRFCHIYASLDKKLRSAIVIENDDKVFTVDDCLHIHDRIGVPIVFDYHHHFCNPGTLPMKEFLPRVFNSWGKRVPKIHFSSPKNKLKKEFRSHHEYIQSDVFISFLEQLKKYSVDLDIMIEAKKKDEAMFRLIRELKYKTNYLFLDETTFLI